MSQKWLVALLVFARGGVRLYDADKSRPGEAAINEKTRLLFIEAVGNPALDIADIEGYAEVAHRHGLPLVVDATFTPPPLLRALVAAYVNTGDKDKFYRHGSAKDLGVGSGPGFSVQPSTSFDNQITELLYNIMEGKPS